MNKLNIMCSFLLVVAVFLSSCLKDKGNYTYKELPQFYIDTVGQPVSFQVNQNGVVKIDPKIVFDGDERKLKFLYFIHGADPRSHDTISTERNLNYKTDRAPGTYTIRLEVSQENGVTTFMPFTMQVLPAFSAGWMVMYESNDQPGSTDIDIIRSPKFLGSGADTVYRNAFSIYNEKLLPGLPRDVYYGGPGVMVSTTGTALSLDITDFKVMQSYEDLFPYPHPDPATHKTFMRMLNGQTYLIAGSTIYWSSGNVFVGEVLISGGGKLDLAPFIYPELGENGGFYDPATRRFLKHSQNSTFATAYPDAAGTVVNGVTTPPLFNLNNIGKDILFVDKTAGRSVASNDAYKLAIFKDVNGAGRYVYVFDTGTESTNPGVKLLDITSAPEIQDAKFYATPNVGRMVMYATSTTLYGFTYSALGDYTTAGNVYNTPAPVFTAPAGEEITCLKLNKTINSASATTAEPRDLFIATWNAAAKVGHVYHFIVNEAEGKLISRNGVWTINGKVGAMGFKGA